MAKHSSISEAHDLNLDDDLSVVYEMLVDISPKWYDTGLQLKVKPTVLNRIRSQYSDPTECLRETLSEWLMGIDPYPTWEALARALESNSVKEVRLAKKVRETYLVSVTTIRPTSATLTAHPTAPMASSFAQVTLHAPIDKYSPAEYNPPSEIPPTQNRMAHDTTYHTPTQGPHTQDRMAHATTYQIPTQDRLAHEPTQGHPTQVRMAPDQTYHPPSQGPPTQDQMAHNPPYHTPTQGSPTQGPPPHNRMVHDPTQGHPTQVRMAPDTTYHRPTQGPTTQDQMTHNPPYHRPTQGTPTTQDRMSHDPTYHTPTQGPPTQDRMAHDTTYHTPSQNRMALDTTYHTQDPMAHDTTYHTPTQGPPTQNRVAHDPTYHTPAEGPPTQDRVTHDLSYHHSTQRPPMHVSLPPYTPAPQVHPIDQYSNYLRDYYEGDKLPVYDKWPPSSSKKFIHLAVVKKKPVSKKEADEFTRSTLHGNIDDIVWKKGPLDFSQVGIKDDGAQARMILVEGAPGIGKTTFAWEVGRMWSKQKILQWCRLVVLLRLRDKRVREAKTVYDLLYYSDDDIRRDVAKEVTRNNGNSVLLLFEGFDELPKKLQTQESIFLDILYREKLPKATVLITSRPSATQFLHNKFKTRIDQHIEILGFTKADVHSYVQSVMENQQLQTEFSQYLKCYPHIQGLLYVPLNAVIVTEIYKTTKLNDSEEFVPTTLTELYTSLTRGMLLRYLENRDGYCKQQWKLRSFSDLPEELHEQFHTICEVAFQGILKEEFIFDDLADDFNTLDLMQSVAELYVDQGAVVSHNFFHLTLQEFLAAVHVSHQPTEEQLQYFIQSTPSWLEQLQLDQQRQQDELLQHILSEQPESRSQPRQLQPLVLSMESITKPSANTSDDATFLPTTSQATTGIIPLPPIHLSQLQQVLQPLRLQGLIPEKGSATEPATCISESPPDPVPHMPQFFQISTLPSTQEVVPEVQTLQRTPLQLQETLQVSQTKPSTPSISTQDHRRLEPLQIPVTSHHTAEVSLSLPGSAAIPELGSIQLETPQPGQIVAQQLVSPNQPLSLTNTLPTSPSAGALPYSVLTSSHFQNVLKYAAGLTKFKSLSTTSMKSILLLQDDRGKQEIPLYSLHWLFEAQCIGTYSEVIGEETQLTFHTLQSLNPFDCFVLGFALSHINCTWNIYLTGSHIGDEGLEMLVAGMHYSEAALLSSLNAVSLNLEWCDISSVGLNHLKEMPEQVATRITELNLNYNEGISEGVPSILRKLKSLKALNLAETSLSPQEVEQLADLLPHSQLQCLNLSISLGSPESTNHILRVLSHKSTLREVYMRGAHISQDNLFLLTSALKTNTTIRKLDLSFCNINDNMVSEITTALCDNSTLESLNLGYNAIGLRGATAVSEMLRRNKTLRELFVWGNSIGEEGTPKLTSSLEHNSTLESLNLRSNDIGPKGATALSEMLRRNKTLRELNVMYNSIGEEGTLKLASSLEHNSTLEKLVIDDNYKYSLPPELLLKTKNRTFTVM